MIPPSDALLSAIDGIKGQRILLSPLDWGLGHASRCVPIVKLLLSRGKEVVIAGNGNSLKLLKSEFPHLEAAELDGVSIHYSHSKHQMCVLFMQLSSIFWHIRCEHRQLKRIVKEHNIDTIISDNRFGLWHQDLECVYITHQLMVKMPSHLKWAEPIIHRWHLRVIAHYTHCWIPDVEVADGSLSGDLSHKYPLPSNARFVGWLSRFQKEIYTESSPYANIAVISGPEPQRSLFEKKMVELLWATKQPSLIVRGVMDADAEVVEENVTLVASLPTKRLQFLLTTTPHIYCRSGYSSLMDLAVLGRKATLFATPGQPEQEYLQLINEL